MTIEPPQQNFNLYSYTSTMPMVSTRHIWCALAGQPKALEVDSTDCDYIYDLKKAVVDSSRIDIPYFRVELWKIKQPEHWPAGKPHILWHIPNDSRGLRKIAEPLYAHESLDKVHDQMDIGNCVSIIAQFKNGKNSLHSIIVPERRIWCAFLGQSQIFQIDIAKCDNENRLVVAISRRANLAAYKINELWKVKDPRQWTVNDSLRRYHIPKTKKELVAVAEFLEFGRQLKESMFDDDLRLDNIYLFATLKEMYSLPPTPASITPIWCVVAGSKRVFQVDIGRCASMSEVINMAEERSGIPAIIGVQPTLYKIKDPRMWPIEKFCASAFPEYNDAPEETLHILYKEDSMDRLSFEDPSHLKDYICLVLDVPGEDDDVYESVVTSPAPFRYIWCAIGKQNYVCRINIGGCKCAYEVLQAIQEQSNLDLELCDVKMWKMKSPQSWPVGDVVRGVKIIPNSEEEAIMRIASQSEHCDDLFADLDDHRLQDNVYVFIQTLCQDISTDSSDAINPFVDRADIQVALDELGFRSDAVYVTLDRRHIGHVYTEDNRKYFVKYLRPGRSDEIEILEYLRRFRSPQNHSPMDVISYRLEEGALLLTPDLGIPVKKYELISRDLLSIVQQLLEGVAFLHTHGVAHMDLKSSHILVDKYGKVSIIDYDISVMLKDGEVKLKGYRGTEGWTAPEVGPKSYDAYQADVWATGRIVRELCDLCPLHVDLDFLRGITEQMTVTDPIARSSLQMHLEAVSVYIINKV